MTALDIISSALRKLGILAAGETASAGEANDALIALNDMVDTWSNEQLLIVSRVTETFPLVIGQQSYQMGTGAPDFNTARPQRIENALWQQTSGSTTVNLPIEIINQDQWAALTVPATQSNISTKLFPNYTYPYATLYFWPIPKAVNNLILWSWKPLSNISLLTSTVNLPPGYAKALKYNLALELAPDYGKSPSDLVVANAVESKAAIKRMNNKPILLGCDAAVLPQRPVFNYLTGE